MTSRRTQLKRDDMMKALHHTACMVYRLRTLHERQYKSFFGASIETICVLWYLLDDRQSRPSFSMKHLFWALAWLKQYTTETVLAANMGTTPKTFRNRVREVLEAINARYADVVSTIFNKLLLIQF